MTPADRHGRQVVRTAFVVAVFGWGIGFYGPAVYLPALHEGRGWPISTISTAITIHYLVSAVLVSCLPDIYRRFDVGRVTMGGAVLAAGGAMAWANADQVWQLVPALLLSGAGWSAMSGAALNAMVAPWFERDRPKAISAAFNGASLGGLLFTPLWTALIAGVGLPLAALAVAVAAVAVVCPLAWCFLRRDSPVSRQKAEMPLPRRLLLRQRRFVTISIAFALGLFAQIGLFVHLIARLEPEFGPTVAASAISVVTLCAMLGRTLLGRLLSKHDRRLAAAGNLLMQAAGSLMLTFGDDVTSLAVGGVLFGLGVGNLTSLPPLIAQCEFRPADVGTVVALVTAINQAVFAFAPAVLGNLRDLTGNYTAAFLTVAAAQVTAAGVIVLGRRSPETPRRLAESGDCTAGNQP